MGSPWEFSEGFSCAAPDGNPDPGDSVLRAAPGSTAEGGPVPGMPSSTALADAASFYGRKSPLPTQGCCVSSTNTSCRCRARRMKAPCPTSARCNLAPEQQAASSSLDGSKLPVKCSVLGSAWSFGELLSCTEAAEQERRCHKTRATGNGALINHMAWLDACTGKKTVFYLFQYEHIWPMSFLLISARLDVFPS